MSDTVSKEKRSEIMSHVTGKETEPEIIVRKFLFACLWANIICISLTACEL